MAKKQTRRSVSLERHFYDALLPFAESRGMAVSEYLTRLARADMIAAGAEVPPLGRFASDVAPPRDPVVPRPKPRVPLVTKSDQDGEAKYRAALEFQRQNLAKKPPEPEPAAKPKECWWCGDRFKLGELSVEVNGNRLHNRCKREMGRVPPGVS